MTPIVMLTAVTGLLASLWLTRSRWQHSPALDPVVTAASPHAQRSLGIAGVLAAFLLAGPVACYLWLGEPGAREAQPLRSRAAPAIEHLEPAHVARDDAASNTEARVSMLTEHLAERLKSRPDDAEGWQTLGRSYAALGRHAQAAAAFKNAARLRPNDATLLAEYAFSAAVTDPHAAEGEAAQLTARALQIDPKNAKALALAGTLAVDRKDYQGAVRHWEQLALVEPADSPTARQVQSSILQARQLASAHAGVPQARSLPPAADVPGPVRAQASRTASLAPTLSSASSVVIGAAIARGSGVVAHDGDLPGPLAPVAVGRGDLKMQINEVLHTR